MSIALVVPVDSSNTIVDPDAAVVASLNALFRRSGLHRSTASTQLHIMPETVYVVSREDAAVLARNARVLVTNSGVQCDFSVLSGVLWGHVKEVENALDNFLQQQQQQQLSEIDVKRSNESAVTPLLVQHLVVLTQSVHTLRHMEEPFTRKEVRDAVYVVQKDVEMLIRLAFKITGVLEETIKNFENNDVTILRATELCLGAMELFAASLTMRNSIDVSPVLAFFNSDKVWNLSGVGVVSTESYCESIRRLISAIFSRQEDFAGVEKVAVQLLLNRLTDRPPFDWKIFKKLFILSGSQTPMGSLLTPQYGLLRFMSIVQLCVESLLLSDKPWVKIFKREISNALHDKNEKKKMLSFFQVSLLGIIWGIPELDLYDDVQLQRRAKLTKLSNNEEVLNPNFLRILLAHGFTVPNENHSLLNRNSIVSLFRAISDQIFQIPIIKSGKLENLTNLILKSPILTSRIIQLIVTAVSQDSESASDILTEIRQITEVIYETSVLQCNSFKSPKKISIPFRRVSVLVMELLFKFFNSNSLLIEIDPRLTLESLVRIFAVRVFYIPAETDVTESEKRIVLKLIRQINMTLSSVTQKMTSPIIKEFFENIILISSSKEELNRKNRQHYALVEAYLRSFASSSVALVMDENVMLRHWVDIAIRSIKNPLSGALSIAGLDFLGASFLSKRALAPLFVPTYVSILVPLDNPPRYGNPPLFLVRHFAKTVRAICQSLEECDEQALFEMLHNPTSPLRKFVAEMHGEESLTSLLGNVHPTSSVLLIVSALFDKSCILLGYSANVVSREERLSLFQAYFSALINLLQCRNSTVLHRVCASVEAIILEHLRGVPSAQRLWMKYISSTVDNIDGGCKKGVAEWFLKLSEKTKKVIPQSKL